VIDQIQASAALSQGKASILSRADLEKSEKKKYLGFAGNQTRGATYIHHNSNFNVPTPEDNAFKLNFILAKGHPVQLYCTGLFNYVRSEEQSCNTFSRHALLIFFQNS
jgi:hypothetical protein